MVEVPVADGIKRPEELINTALDTNRKPFVAQGGSKKHDDNEEKLSPGKAFYKHLMNGVSNMLPLVISGGILIAIVFLFGANSFNLIVQNIMHLLNNYGILVKIVPLL